MADIENDELKTLISSLIKSYPILKFDCILEWISSIYDNYIKNGGKQKKKIISIYSVSIQFFCNFHFISPDVLLTENFEKRIERINGFKEHFNADSTYQSHKRRVKSFYSYYGLIAERPKPRPFFRLEKANPELTKRYLGEKTDIKSDLRRKIENDIKLMEFEDVSSYLQDFFETKNYFSIGIFVKYLLTYVLGIDSGNGNYEKYMKKLSYKYDYVSKILENQGFIEPYNNSFKILNRNTEKLELNLEHII